MVRWLSRVPWHPDRPDVFVRVPADGAFATARPPVLFDFQAVVSNAGLDDFDVTSDGRFLFFKPTSPRPDAPQVVVN
jgi:hypothetical protein